MRGSRIRTLTQALLLFLDFDLPQTTKLTGES